MHHRCTILRGFAAASLLGLAAPSAVADSYSQLHAFCSEADCGDGALPQAALVMDASGNLYGTTTKGGAASSYGIAYELQRTGSTYVEHVIYQFNGKGPLNYLPGPLASDGTGNLFGESNAGLFELTPVPKGLWKGTLLYAHGSLDDNSDHVLTIHGREIFTTDYNSTTEVGSVVKLVPSGSSYTAQKIASWRGGTVANYGMFVDGNGDVYGTTAVPRSNANLGTVFKLTPTSSGYAKTTLFVFKNALDGDAPQSGVVLDAQGNVYGTTSYGGKYGLGTVYKLTRSGGSYTESVIDSLGSSQSSGVIPLGAPFIDASGKLYFTTPFVGRDGNGLGALYSLSPSGTAYAETLVHRFQGNADGATPLGSLFVDEAGSIYGATAKGGGGSCFKNGAGCGVIYKI